ncbi:MAG TPA: ABC transporter ATP-binding protein [Gammaproteobacteria bacterium]|nr:ABC transporter ATP-binding protein [Gammaproteobacteria bacterium]
MTDHGNSFLLDISALNLSFSGNQVLSDVSFGVRRKTIASVIGPNGAGKTSLFNSITGFYKPQSGRILFEAEPLLGKKPHQITEQGIARTFQNVRLFRHMSVLENVMSGMHCRTRSGAIDAVLKTPRHRREEEEIHRYAQKCLDFVGLLQAAERLANNLPYGHQRLVEIARALATQPRLILLDEPAAGLTSQEKDNLVGLIQRIRDEWDVAVLLIEHDMGLVMKVSENITVLDHGKVIAEGSASAIQQNPLVIEAYLGQEDVELDSA